MVVVFTIAFLLVLCTFCLICASIWRQDNSIIAIHFSQTFKYWGIIIFLILHIRFHDRRPAVGAYAQVLQPPVSVCDVTYWLNYLLSSRTYTDGSNSSSQNPRNHYAAINTAGEKTIVCKKNINWMIFTDNFMLPSFTKIYHQSKQQPLTNEFSTSDPKINSFATIYPPAMF